MKIGGWKIYAKKWLRRNKIEEAPKKHDGKRDHRERNWYIRKRMDEEQKERVKPHCLYCEKGHWGESCDVVGTLAKRREFFMMKRLCFNCGRPGHTEKDVEVEATLNVRLDTTQACVINKSLPDTSQQVKKNHCQPLFH